MKISELDKMIRNIVQEEFKSSVKKYIHAYIPIVMKEVVDDLVKKQLVEIVNSNKKKVSLKENISKELAEEWPTLGGEVATTNQSPQLARSKLARLMGYGDTPTKTGPINTIDSVVTENGAVIPIPPDAIPPAVMAALNKDYRKFMKAVDEHKGAGMSVPPGTIIGGR